MSISQNKKYNISVSLIMPAHNAEKIIEKSISEYLKFLSKYKKYELIIACNGCTDSTVEVASKIARRNKNIRILDIDERGKGFAILTGFRWAQNDIIGFMDADNVFKLDSVAGMISHLNKYDCVIASKWLGRNIFEITEPFTRKALAVGWKALTLGLFFMRFHDTQAGCKFLRKSSFKKIDHQFICTGFDFDVELLYSLKRTGFKIKEFNIPVLKSFKFSTFRLKFVPLMFWRLFRMRFSNIKAIKKE